MSFAEGYIDVASRLVEFREKHPDGSLQPADLTQPYRIETIGGDTYIVVVTAAYRSPDDVRPGIGMAYEAYPGKTPYTRGSELQNCETSSWGRAIVAALAADTRKGVASADEVRNRQAERDEQNAPRDPKSALRARIAATARESRDWSATDTASDFASWSQGVSIAEADEALLRKYLAYLDFPEEIVAGLPLGGDAA